MPLVIPPSTLDVLTSLYSDTVIIDDIIEHYQIQNQVKKFLFEHYKFNLPLEAEIIVYCQSQPSVLIIECKEPVLQIKLDGETGQMTDINLMCSDKCSEKLVTPKAVCEHINWKSQDNADGISDCYSCDCRCNDCHQLLAHGVSSISGTFYNIFDQAWADRNRMTDIEY